MAGRFSFEKMLVTRLSTARSVITSCFRRSPEQLVITERAVEKHITSIFSKLNLPATSEHHRRVLAVLTFLRA